MDNMKHSKTSASPGEGTPRDATSATPLDGPHDALGNTEDKQGPAAGSSHDVGNNREYPSDVTTMEGPPGAASSSREVRAVKAAGTTEPARKGKKRDAESPPPTNEEDEDVETDHDSDRTEKPSDHTEKPRTYRERQRDKQREQSVVDPHAGVGKKRRLEGPPPDVILEQIWDIIEAGGLRDNPKIMALYNEHFASNVIEEDTDMREASPEPQADATSGHSARTSGSTLSSAVPNASSESASGFPAVAPASTPFVNFLAPGPASSPAQMTPEPVPGPSSLPQSSYKTKKAKASRRSDDDLYALPDEVFEGHDSDLEISIGVDPNEHLSDSPDDNMDGLEHGPDNRDLSDSDMAPSDAVAVGAVSEVEEDVEIKQASDEDNEEDVEVKQDPDEDDEDEQDYVMKQLQDEVHEEGTSAPAASGEDEDEEEAHGSSSAHDSEQVAAVGQQGKEAESRSTTPRPQSPPEACGRSDELAPGEIRQPRPSSSSPGAVSVTRTSQEVKIGDNDDANPTRTIASTVPQTPRTARTPSEPSTTPAGPPPPAPSILQNLKALVSSVTISGSGGTGHAGAQTSAGLFPSLSSFRERPAAAGKSNVGLPSTSNIVAGGELDAPKTTPAALPEKENSGARRDGQPASRDRSSSRQRPVPASSSRSNQGDEDVPMTDTFSAAEEHELPKAPSKHVSVGFAQSGSGDPASSSPTSHKKKKKDTLSSSPVNTPSTIPHETLAKHSATRVSGSRTRNGASTVRSKPPAAATTPSQSTGASGAASAGSSGVTSVFTFRFGKNASRTATGKAAKVDSAGEGQPSSQAGTSVPSTHREAPRRSPAPSNAGQPAVAPKPVAKDSSRTRSASAGSRQSASSQVDGAKPKPSKGKERARDAALPMSTSIFSARSPSRDSQSSDEDEDDPVTPPGKAREDPQGASDGESKRRRQEYASKRDMERLTDAVGGLQAEVREITTHLKRGKANSSDSGAGPSSGSARKSSGKSGPSQANAREANAREDVADDYEADLDEPEKLTNPTKHRTPEQNDLAADVASHMLTLLRRSDKFAPFKKASLANEIMARGYRKSDGPCCTAENFQLDINGTPGSPWNDSARKVFVEDFLKVGSHKCRDRRKITAMFRSHFRTVQSHYAKHGVEPDEGDPQPGPSGNTSGGSSNATHGAAPKPAPKKTPNSVWFKSRPKASKARPASHKEHSRYQRKYTLFQRRYRSAARYTLTKRFLWVLRKLGVDGMSSDEEDDDAPFRRFRVYDVPWRSEAVTKMLRALDALHRRWRRKSSKRGAQPRMRYLANEPTATPTPAVPRLPINAYKRPWYDDIPSFERDDLNARPTEFDFQVPQAIKTAISDFRAIKMDDRIYV